MMFFRLTEQLAQAKNHQNEHMLNVLSHFFAKKTVKGGLKGA